MVALTLRLAFVAALLWAQAGFAQTENRPADVQSKAACLYKLGDSVQWPRVGLARADAPFVIGVLAADDLAGGLEQLVANRSVQGHPVAVRRVRRGEPLAGLHVLFIGQAESARLAETRSQ